MRGQIWENIAAALNSLQQPKFRVIASRARAVGDRYSLLTSKQKQIHYFLQSQVNKDRQAVFRFAALRPRFHVLPPKSVRFRIRLTPFLYLNKDMTHTS